VTPGSDYVLGGPVYWIVVGLQFATAMLAVFVVIDTLRRSFLPMRKEAEPLRWYYLVPQAIYFVFMMLGEGRLVPDAFAAGVVLVTPFALAQGFAYLLRVVFPKPAVAVDADATTEDERPPDTY